MGVQIKTTIIEVDQALDKTKDIVENNVNSCFVTGAINTFLAERIEDKSLEFKGTEVISIQLFDEISIPIAKTTFVYIACRTKILLPADVVDPIKFQITFDSTGTPLVLGKFSEFELIDMEAFTKPILVDDITIPTDKTLELFIIVGGKF